MFKLAHAGMNTYCPLTIDAYSPRKPSQYPHKRRIYLIFPETTCRIIGLHFATDIWRRRRTFFWRAP